MDRDELFLALIEVRLVAFKLRRKVSYSERNRALFVEARRRGLPLTPPEVEAIQ